MNWLSSIISLFSNWLGYSKQRSEVRNAPDVKAAAIAKQEQAEVDKTNKAVASRNEAEIRKELAE